MKPVSQVMTYQKIILKNNIQKEVEKLSLEIIGTIGEHNAKIYDLYLKGILCKSELKALIGYHNYEQICALRQ